MTDARTTEARENARLSDGRFGVQSATEPEGGLQALSVDVSDPRRTTHWECDCVPHLGPSHCHLCGDERGVETPWSQCTSVRPNPRTRRSQLPRNEDGDRIFDPHVPGIPGDGSPVVLDVDKERGLTFTWFDISRRKQDWQLREDGYLVSKVAVTDIAGNEVGRITITHTTPELLAQEVPTPFHWADRNSGMSMGYRWNDEVPLEKLWASAWTALHEIPPSAKGRRSWGALEKSEAPTDPEVLEAELAEAEARFAAQMKRWAANLSVPLVDYSHLDETMVAPNGETILLRGTGTGKSLYILAAKQLAKQGKVLRASGLQSDEAQALWERLIADPDVPTSDVTVPYSWHNDQDVKTLPCLDYRDR